MFIRDIFRENEAVVSFEIFPPKESSSYEVLSNAIAELATLNPNFMSVTYGAGGGTSKNTVNICKQVQQNDITALAHLTCVSATKKDIENIVGQFKENGIQNILALRGDRPKGGAQQKSEYHYANELVSALKSQGDFCIGGACYPEGHLESKDIHEDIEHIKMKVDAGCEFLITQLYFDNAYLYRYMDLLHKKGIHIPVIPGLMPVQSAKQVFRMCQLSGASIPVKFQKMLDKYADKPEAIAQAGIAYVTDQIIDLYANDIKGVHIYTMNKPDIAQKIVKNIDRLY